MRFDRRRELPLEMHQTGAGAGRRWLAMPDDALFRPSPGEAAVRQIQTIHPETCIPHPASNIHHPPSYIRSALSSSAPRRLRASHPPIFFLKPASRIEHPVPSAATSLNLTPASPFQVESRLTKNIKKIDMTPFPRRRTVLPHFQ